MQSWNPNPTLPEGLLAELAYLPMSYIFQLMRTAGKQQCASAKLSYSSYGVIDVEFSLHDDGEDGGHNCSGFVEMPEIFVIKDDSF